MERSDMSIESDDSSVEMPHMEGEAHDEGKKSRGSQKNTIFIGNWPNEAGRNELKKMFREYGEILSMRFRSAIRQDLKTPKKLAIIKKQFHSDVSSINAYIQFSTQKSCENALEKNGFLYRDHHLRVTLAKNQLNQHNSKRAVFVGNLSFKIQDNDLWNAFEDCGAIESVRVVRDAKTGVGKGFGYVNFKSADSVELAVRLNGVNILNRDVRVARADNAMPSKTHNKLEKNVKPQPFKKNINNKKFIKNKTEKREKVKTKPYFQGQKTKPAIHKKHKKNNKLDKKKMQIKLIAEGLNKKKQ